ncbi:MAG TPA: hypothetical protein VJ725_23930 [Thermoanaerobaculia bacterium]|nr:hypothetical protein [Thermoanaerobaculia bacterium]
MPALRSLSRKPLPKPSPESDPRFRKVQEQLKAGAAKTKAHPPARKKAGDAAAAAKGPPNERLAAGKAKQVDKIKEAKEGKPEPSSFLEMLRAEIAKVMPKTLGQTENFDQTAQQVKGGLKSNVSQQTATSKQDVAGASNQAPAPTGEAKTGGEVPKEPTPGTPAVNGPEGMPAPKSDADVSLQDSKQDTDAQMKEAEVTPQQLQKANDPRFSAVLDAKSQVARQADAGPAKYRASEKATLNAAAAGAQAESRRGAATLVGVRSGSNNRVLTRQQQQKAADEKKRLDVVAQIEAIFAQTKSKVDQKLESLDTEVGAMFDQGTEAALNAMTTFVNARIRRYKIDRYLSIPVVGAARWIRDQFLGLPDEVNAFYEQGRQLFQSRMDALVVRVAALVERRLKEAKDEVARGQAAIKKLVAEQSPALQKQLQETVQNVTERFSELERGIEDKKNQLAQSLAQKYKEGFDKANEALKKIQDENKGFVQAFVEKLGEVIKALLEFKAKLMAILRKGMETIKLIIADPLGFLSNLIAAVKGGIQAFVGNIWTHLKKGFMTWLFGALAGAGVEIPSDLSLPSILKLVLGVLGITYDRMRAKAVRLIGERNVKIIEKLVEYIRTLISGGPAALWEKVKEDLSNLKAMVIDAIQNWLIETVVKQAVAKIVSMFNPAGAIVQAIIAIYNIVMFVVEKAQQIMAFVEAVVNSVHAIATGAIGGAISWIEQALARTIPIVIGFLARLIGLGGISQKIKEFITKVQSKVDAAIDKAIAKIVAFVKKMFGGQTARADNRTPAQQEADLGRAAVEATQLQNRPGVKLEQVRAGLPAIRSRYNLSSAEVEHGEGEKYHINLVINPRRKTEDKEYKAKYKLLPGTFEQHEGMEIIPGDVNGARVHLITVHGAHVSNDLLIGRLRDLRNRYEVARARQRTLLDRQLDQLQIDHDAEPNANKKRGIRNHMETVGQQRRALDSLNLNNAAEIIRQMRNWGERDIPPMATRWKSKATMVNVINKAIADKAQEIDEAFAANPRQGAGHSVDVLTNEWAGEGYQFVGNTEIAPIGRPLNRATVVFRLVDVQKKHFVVLTAFPVPV